MCQSQVEAWETTKIAADLAMEKSAFRTTCTRTINDSWVQTFNILCVLFIQIVNVNVLRHPGVPGPPIPRLLVIFCFYYFFFQSEPRTQYQETHSTLNEKKGGMALPEITSSSK